MTFCDAIVYTTVLGVPFAYFAVLLNAHFMQKSVNYSATVCCGARFLQVSLESLHNKYHTLRQHEESEEIVVDEDEDEDEEGKEENEEEEEEEDDESEEDDGSEEGEVRENSSWWGSPAQDKTD